MFILQNFTIYDHYCVFLFLNKILILRNSWLKLLAPHVFGNVNYIKACLNSQNRLMLTNVYGLDWYRKKTCTKHDHMHISEFR